MDRRWNARPAADRPVDCDPTTFGQQRAAGAQMIGARRMGKSQSFEACIALFRAMGYQVRLTHGAAYFFAPGVAKKALNGACAGGLRHG